MFKKFITKLATWMTKTGAMQVDELETIPSYDYYDYNGYYGSYIYLEEWGF